MKALTSEETKILDQCIWDYIARLMQDKDEHGFYPARIKILKQVLKKLND